MLNWTLNGTKILGYIVGILSAIGAGSVLLPPPLNAHKDIITAWCIFINFLLAPVIVLRGYTNTDTLNALIAAPNTHATIATDTKTPNKVLAWIFLPLLSLLAIGNFSGCASTPSAAQSFEDSVYAAAKINVTVISTLDGLVKTHAVSSTQASAILAITDKVQATLNLANSAYTAGNSGSATSMLSTAAAALASVQACLTAPASLSTCLQSVTL